MSSLVKMCSLGWFRCFGTALVKLLSGGLHPLTLSDFPGRVGTQSECIGDQFIRTKPRAVIVHDIDD